MILTGHGADRDLRRQQLLDLGRPLTDCICTPPTLFEGVKVAAGSLKAVEIRAAAGDLA